MNHLYRREKSQITQFIGSKILYVKSTIIALLLMFGANQTAHATHLAASDLTYRYLGDVMVGGQLRQQYEITITLYRDCKGIPAPLNLQLVASSANCGSVMSSFLSPIDSFHIPSNCNDSLISACGGYGTDYARFIYRDTLNLKFCSDWIFSFRRCCRNCAVTTLNHPFCDVRMYVEATLDNLNYPGNSSPTFTTIPVSEVCNMQVETYVHSAIDIDGDMLTYGMTDPLDNVGNPVPWLPGYSANLPLDIAPATTFTIDPNTGLLTYTPDGLNITIMAVLVAEIDPVTGDTMGTVTRDMQVIVINCANIEPIVTGINGTGIFNATICPNGLYCFDIPSVDPDAGQIVTMTWNNGITGATLTVSPDSVPTGTFCWTPDSSDISLTPHTFTLTVIDDACPTPGAGTYLFEILVQCITIDEILTNPSCNGLANGSISLNITNATPPISYLWSNGATSQNLNGLAAGVYCVTVTDANSITASECYTLTQPPAINVSNVSIQPSCNGSSNGSINITVSGGSGPYTFVWSNGSITEDISGITAGTYTVTVTDATSCTSSSTIILGQPAALNIAGVSTSPSCFGGANGSVNITVIGGTPAFVYSWSNGASTEDISGLSANNYSVTVTDANGCSATQTFSVTNPPQLTLSFMSVSPSCNGGSNGSINTTVVGGTAPFTFVWTGGLSGEDPINVEAGTYFVTATDANGCTATGTVTVTEPQLLSLSTAVTDVTIPGGSNGSIDLTVTGGTPGFIYIWSNGATTQDISGIVSGTYCVTVTDANGCSSSICDFVDQPDSLAILYVVTNVQCFGDSTGEIDITVLGGTPPYTYLWNTGATTEDLTGVPAGSYSVTVTDQNGSGISDNVTINVTQSAQITFNPTVQSPTCNGGSDASIQLNIQNAAIPFTVLWSTGATTTFLSGITAGTYCVTITDDDGCSNDTCITVNEFASINISGIVSNVTCSGLCNGVINATITGGQAPYSIVWSNGSTTEDLAALCAGTYLIAVTDANGCVVVEGFTVTQPAPLSLSFVSTDILCNADCDGTINLTVTGGTAPYSYLWFLNGETTQDLSGLCADTYGVLVTDANGCAAAGFVTVSQPDALTLSFEIVNVSCNGGNDGLINLIISGGVAPFSYVWSNGLLFEDLTNLTAGTYSVTVTDANGCYATGSATITEAPEFTLSGIVTTVSCNGLCNGFINLNVTGGTPPFIYDWNNGATTQDISGLCAGSYAVVVTDLNGCVAFAGFAISQPAPISFTSVVTDVSCNGGNNGAINLTISGGTQPYSIVWSNGANTEDLSNLTAGVYTVVVTDDNDCIGFANITVSQPAPIILTLVDNEATCNGFSNGTIFMDVAGGTAPYTYLWSNGEILEDILSLAAGTYCVTVTDANNCTATACGTVTEPDAFDFNEVINNISCSGSTDGQIILNTTGGTPTYSYLWSTGDTTNIISGLGSGIYFVTLTDSRGCVGSGSFIVEEPAPLTINATVSNPTCNGLTNGFIDITVSGGTTPFIYIWSNGATTEDIFGLTSGTFCVTVTDANGCVQSSCSTIISPQPIIINTFVICATNYGGNDGSISTNVSGGTAPYTYLWSNGFTTPNVSSLISGTYTLTVTDFNACSAIATAFVCQPDSFTFNFTITDPNCGGLCDGVIIANVSGGTPPYFYLWSNSSTQSIISNLCAGAYCLTVTDINGQIDSTCVSIFEPAPVFISGFVANVTCNGINDGAISITASGGTTPYSYLWSGPSSYSSLNEDITGLAPGAYSVIVTDSAGCVGVASFTITQPPAISLTAVATPIACFGSCTGFINLSISGGTFPVNYAWVGPSGYTANTQDIGNLCVGLYTVLVTDFNGCQSTLNVNITEPAFPITITTNFVTEVSCFGGNTGAININVSGGTPAYTYLWSTGQVTQDIVNLVAGTYIVTVTDANGCQTSSSFIVTQNPPLIVTISLDIPITCFGSCDGQLSVQVSGGDPGGTGYIFDWSNSYNDPTIFNLCAGTYTVTVTDGAGCVLINSATIVDSICNNPPLASDDINNTIMDIPVDGNVLTNDSDPDGDNLVVSSILDDVDFGTLVWNPNGTYTYTPNTGYVGQDQFTYIVCDDGVPSLCDTATVYIEILPGTNFPNNDPPIANADDFIIYVNTSITDGNMIANDYDPDFDNIDIIVVPVTNPVNGTVVINAGGTFDYVPNIGFVGQDQFTYQLCDDGIPVLCDIGVVTIHVIEGIDTLNNPPVAVDDAAYTNTDVPVNGDLSTNDYDIDGDSLIYTTTPLDAPDNGTVIINPDGTYTYTPDNGYNGPDNFTYIVCDNGSPSMCDTATAYIIVQDINNPPLASDDINNTLLNTPVNGNVLTNDNDPDGDPITVTTNTVTTNQGVIVNIAPNGDYTYTPPVGYTGQDQFTYTVCDNGVPQLCDVATVYIEILPPGSPQNNPPIANADDFITYPFPVVLTGNIIANDYDPDFDNVIITTIPVVNVSNGTLIIFPNGTFDYQPDPLFVGQDTFMYQICDDGIPSLCDIATVIIHVIDGDTSLGNNPPVAVDDAAYTNTDTPVSGDLSENDYDVDGDSLVYNTTPLCGPSNGTVVINADGSYTYTPNAGYVGPDNFCYGVCDDGIPSLCDTATAYIIVQNANNPPVAEDDINNTLQNIPVDGNVLTNDMEPDGDNMTTTLLTLPTNGIVVLQPNGDYTYTPDPNYIGEDNFSYVVCDDGVPVLCDTAVVYIEILPNDQNNNNPPVANADDFVTYMDIPVNGNVLPNDFDTDNDPLTVTTIPVVNPTNGTVTLNANGTFTYIPNSGFVGQDQFQYQVCDPGGLCDIAVVTIHMLPSISIGNLPPVAVDDAAWTPYETPVSGNLLDNDYDLDGNNILINIIPISGPSNGTVVILPNGDYTYTPDPGYLGPDQFIYQICDDGIPSGCDVATAYITVIPVPPCVSYNVVPITCNGADNGEITLTITCGVDPFSILWSTGETTLTISNLGVGCYSVSVSDTFGNTTVIDSICLVEPNPIAIILVSMTQSDCDTANGALNISVIGGTPNYSYLWNTGQITEDINNISAGTYCVTITDANGCTATECFNVTNPTLDVSINVDNGVTCEGGSDGILTTTATGGSGNYSYLWSNNGLTQTISNLSAGNYTVAVTDLDNGCVGFASITLYPEVILTISIGVVNSNCGNSDGSATAFVTGGSGSYAYNWSNGQITQTATGLSAGTYTVTVTDNVFGCTKDTTVVVNNVSDFTISLIGLNDAVCGGATGNINIGVSGGSGIFNYLWTPGNVTSQDVSGLVGNATYCVEVTDSISGCVQNMCFFINEISPMTLSNFNITDADCGTSSGSITASVVGGTPNYAWHWNTGVNIIGASSGISNLAAGYYYVTITDGNGCELIEQFLVGNNSPISITAILTDATCNGDGSIDLSASGGNGALSYSWSNGAVTQDINGLIGGAYSVTVTDTLGCAGFEIFYIFDAIPIIVNISSIDPTCQNLNDGSITTVVNGGTSPYSFSWTGPNGFTSSSQDINNLVSGIYCLDVTDANGCVVTVCDSIGPCNCPPVIVDGDSISLSVNENSSLTFCFTITDPDGNTTTMSIANGPFNGTISLADPCFTYTPDPGYSGPDSFMVIVCDPGSFGCPSMCDSAMVYIDVIPDIPCDTPQFELDTLYCELQQDSSFTGCVNILFSGIYTLSILDQPDNGTVTLNGDCFTYTPDAGFTGGDTLSLIVCNTDPNCLGLDLCDTLVVIKDVVGGIKIPNVITPNNDGTNDYFVIKGIQNYPDNEVQIFNRWGNKVFEDHGYLNEWNGTYNGDRMPDGTYYYVVNLNHKDYPEAFTGFLVIHR